MSSALSPRAASPPTIAATRPASQRRVWWNVRDSDMLKRVRWKTRGVVMASVVVSQILALALLSQAPAAEQPAGTHPAPTAEQIQAAARQLGADNFRERQKASELLWQA